MSNAYPTGGIASQPRHAARAPQNERQPRRTAYLHSSNNYAAFWCANYDYRSCLISCIFYSGRLRGWCSAWDSFHGLDGPRGVCDGLFFLSQAWWRRFGVDPGRVWSRYGPVYYREAKFSEVTRVRRRTLGLKVYSPSGNLNIDSNRFDYALVYLRLLEELQHRRFTLDRTEPTDPNWEAQAQAWRTNLSGEIYMDHVRFYDSHPKALAYLRSLRETPTHYDN